MKKFERRLPVLNGQAATPANHVPPRVQPVAFRNGQPVVGAYATRDLTKAEIKALRHFQYWLAQKVATLRKDLTRARGAEAAAKVDLEVTDRQAAKYRQVFPGNCRVRVLSQRRAPATAGVPAPKTRPD